MPSNDETVCRDNLVIILNRVRREGWQAGFEVLQHEEPVLAGFALAAADLLAERLARHRMPRRTVIFVHSEIMTAQLVCIEAMRQASRELWKDFLPDTEPEKQ